MARTPNYSFERAERERQKANKVAQKAAEKREQREKARNNGEPTEGSEEP